MVRALFVILAVAIAAVSTEVSSIISTVTMFYERCSGGVPFSRPDGKSNVVVKLRQLQYLYWNIHTRPAVFVMCLQFCLTMGYWSTVCRCHCSPKCIAQTL